MKCIKIVRGTAVVMILTIIMSLVFAVSASAANWKDITIGQGKYQGFTTSDSNWFSVPKDAQVKESITFSKAVSSTVTAGYYTPGPNYTQKLSGNGTTTISGTYTIKTAGNYKFYIYNGSSDKITVSSMTVTF